MLNIRYICICILRAKKRPRNLVHWIHITSRGGAAMYRGVVRNINPWVHSICFINFRVGSLGFLLVLSKNPWVQVNPRNPRRLRPSRKLKMSLDDEQCSCYSSSLNPGYYSCCLSFHQFQDNAFCFELPLQRLCRNIVLFIFFSLQTLQSLVYFVIYSLQFKSLFLCQNCQFYSSSSG